MIKKPLLMRTPLAIAVAAVVVGACGQETFEQEANAEGLEVIIQRYVTAQRGGGDSEDADPFSEASFLARIEADRALLADVQTISPTGLALEQDIDRRLLIGLLESSIRSAETRRTWENDPAIYVPSGQIGRLLGPEAAGSPDERAERIASLLSELPRRLEHARQNLGRPPLRFTEAAIFQVEGAIATLRDAEPLYTAAGDVASGSAAQGAAQAGTVRVDASAYSEGLAQLDSYLAYLQDDVLPRSDGSWAIGKEEYDFILQRRWFLDADADDILQRGWDAFQETERQAQEVAERIEPGKHWVEVYERLKDHHPPMDGIKEAYQAQMDAAQAFVIEQQVVTLPEGEDVVTVDTPPSMRRSSPFGTFQSVSAFGDGLEGRLVLTPIEEWMTPQQQAERLRSHHTAWIPIIAVHEAYPGHHVQAIKLRENPRPLRKVVREPIFSEGWGLFTEELMFELGFLEGEDVKLTQLRNRLWRAARVIMDVSLHTGRMTIDEAVDFLVERVRFERYAAELEVGMYPRRPTYVLGYLIGSQEIAAIRDRWVAEHGAPSPPSELYDRLLRVGSLPPALVAEELLGSR